MKKKIGYGSISLLLSIVCICLSINFNKSGICYGDKLVEFAGLKAWSNGTTGTHYTIFYLLPFFILSIYLGYKFSESFGAKIGRGLSIFFVSLIVISLPFMAISITSYENNVNIKQNSSQEYYLFSLKNEYIGNASADNQLAQAIGVPTLGNYTLELETTTRPYILIINFSNINLDAKELNTRMKNYSTILLALISNADEIHWSVNNVKSGIVTASDVDSEYGNIKDYGNSVESLYSLLVSIGYY